MATLLTPLRGRASAPTAGERRLAERLGDKLEDDYLVWFDVPVGPLRTHPDFVVLHPRRGILVLETKDWALDTVVRADRELWDIAPGGHHKRVVNPLEQARHGAHAVVDALRRDPALVHHDGRYAGQLTFPWGYGVVFTRITRRQLEDSGMTETIDPDSVICADEMTDSVDPEDFQQRLWGFFRHRFNGALTVPQLDRVRWILFPEVRVRPAQGALFAGSAAHEPELPEQSALDVELPDVMAVMDLQQEQLARSLGAGHRVIHGVAGSGKTMILGYRAEYLARTSGPGAPPILVLCFNEPLAVSLAAGIRARGIVERVHVRHFHRWCHQQLTAYGQPIPADGDGFFDRLVDALAHAVERGHVPTGQYQAVLVDEGHDFRPEWLRLIVRMVDPETNSLLVLYDDAQNIYARARAKSFSFKSVGIQAQGRTTILRINYRNTTQILRLAQRVAAGILDPSECDEDGIPVLAPMSCGREGEEPLVVRAADLPAEAAIVADWLATAAESGRPWADLAVVCPDPTTLNACAYALRKRHLPYAVRRKTGDFRPGQPRVTLLSMRVSKGLEFPVVAVPGVGRLPGPDQEEVDAARLLYVAATRATERLLVTVSGDGPLGGRLGV
jgi:hypothetical protein